MTFCYGLSAGSCCQNRIRLGEIMSTNLHFAANFWWLILGFLELSELETRMVVGFCPRPSHLFTKHFSP